MSDSDEIQLIKTALFSHVFTLRKSIYEVKIHQIHEDAGAYTVPTGRRFYLFVPIPPR
jgi:hypothetical protein